MNIYIILIFFLIIILLFNLIKYTNLNSIVNEKNIPNKYNKDILSLNDQKIPKIIIQTWKSVNIPNKYINDILSLKKINPDFEFKFFTDQDIEKFLKNNYPEYYKIYQKLPIKIQKIDYFRYVAVYHFGGFYFDLDITGLKSLSELCSNSCIFPIDMHITNDMCEENRYKFFCENKINFLLGQYAFAAQPKHPFIKKIIENINRRIEKYILIAETPFGRTHDYVYKSTGPDFVTDVYLSYENKKDLTILNYPKGQYFGEYAKHNYYGTWK
jgi:mannosyltransferase OCH1-like enzyme